MRPMRTIPSLGAAATLLLFAATAAAQDFRVETRVYEGEATEPARTSVTLFHEGRVYDFLDNPDEIRVFTSTPGGEAGKFVLLDSQRQLRSEIPTREIVDFMEALRRWARQPQDDPLSSFAADPRFDEAFEPNSTGKHSKLTLTSDVIIYRLQTVPAKDADRLGAFHQFSDWSAQLNVVLNVGSTLPFPRLAATKAMLNRAVVPTEITFSIAAHKPQRPQEVVMRATHDIRWRLSQQDRERIEKVHKQLVNFHLVSYDRYRQVAKKPTDEPTTR